MKLERRQRQAGPGQDRPEGAAAQSPDEHQSIQERKQGIEVAEQECDGEREPVRRQCQNRQHDLRG